MQIHYSDEPVCSVALEFWAALKGEKSMPLKADFNPMDVPQLLPYVLLLEVLDQGRDFSFRVIGTHVREHFVADHTGKTMCSLAHVEEDGPLLRTLRQVVRTGEPIRDPIEYVGPLRDIRKQDEVILPLAGANGEVSHLLIFIEFRPIETLGVD